MLGHHCRYLFLITFKSFLVLLFTFLTSSIVDLCTAKGHLTVASGQSVTSTTTLTTSTTGFSVDLWAQSTWSGGSQYAFVGSGWVFGFFNGQLFFFTGMLNFIHFNCYMYIYIRFLTTGTSTVMTTVPSVLLETGKWVHFAVSIDTGKTHYFYKYLELTLR